MNRSGVSMYAYGCRPYSSTTAWLALNGDLITLADGTRELVNSKGDNVVSISGQMLSFNGTDGVVWTGVEPSPSQFQTVRVDVEDLNTLSTRDMIFGAGYSTTTTITNSLFIATGSVTNQVVAKINQTSGYYEVSYAVPDTIEKATFHATMDANIGDIILYANGIEVARGNFPTLTTAPIEVTSPTAYKYNVGGGGNEFNIVSLVTSNIGNAQKCDTVLSPTQVLRDFINPEDTFNSILTDTYYSNIYLEDVGIPTYDSQDATHIIVTDLNYETALNDAQYSHYFITEGDYANTITITHSGTVDIRKTISLHRADNLHPSRLTELEQASLNLTFDNASYWTVDRISSIDKGGEFDSSYRIINGSSHNIFNRMNLMRYSYGFRINENSNYNTIQNSYLDHMTHAGRLSDNVGIAISSDIDNSSIIGTKIINNDIRNAGDGIQTVRNSGQVGVNYEGAIISGNKIWMDGDVYTNGDYATNGYNPLGEYMIGENAIDLKVGSANSSNPMIIKHNIMYGYREGDATAGGEQSGGAGTAFVSHFGVYHVVFENNIIHDSNVALAGGTIRPDYPYAQGYWSIKNNIFANINVINPEDRQTYAVYLYESEHILWENNIFYNIPQNSLNQGRAFVFAYGSPNCELKNNVFIDAYVYGCSDDNGTATITKNYYYGGSAISATFDADRQVYTTVDEANMNSVYFASKVLENVTSSSIPKCTTTSLSPHYLDTGIIEEFDNNPDLVLAVPLTEGTLAPRVYQRDTTTDATYNHADINASWDLASGLSTGLQKIYFNDDMTKADTMNFSNITQTLADAPLQNYSIKAIGSDETVYV